MKKIILTILMAVLVQIGFAQVLQGNWTTTGSISYYKSQQNGDRYSISYTYEHKYYNISPTIGYVVANNIEVGLIGSYNRSKSNSEKIMDAGVSNTFYNDSRSWSAGVYTKAYKFLLSNFAVTGQADVSYDSYSSDFAQKNIAYYYSNEYVGEHERNYISATISPGISYFLSDKISLNLKYGSLSYTKMDNQAYYRNQAYNRDHLDDSAADGHSLVLNFSSSSFGAGLSFFF
ncbi:hypothetical protein [Pontibacter sp. H249]|uniref:hypothetical protein n=1 Tax=Pontibacter sp. H249 TaxID=3133420 RepID=UPI0030C58B56